MTAWQQLNIEPTTDQRSIKRAYAKLLKQIDQETQPEAFIALRQALEQALFQSQFLDEEDDNEELESSIFSEFNELNEQTHITATNTTTNIDSHRSAQPEDYQQNAFTPLHRAETQSTFEHDNNDNDHEQTTEPLSEQEPQQSNLPSMSWSNTQQETDITPLPIDHNAIDLDCGAAEITQGKYLNQVCQALYAKQVDDEIYAQFQDLLASQMELNLEDQINSKDQLTWALSETEAEIKDPDFFRFLELWLKYYPDDSDLYDEGYYVHNLQQRLNEYKKIRPLLQSTPKKRFTVFNQLSGKKPFRPLAMFKLQQQMVNELHGENILTTIDKYNIADTQQNMNYVFLKSLNHFGRFIVANLIFIFSTYLFARFLLPKDTNTGYLFVCILLLTFVFCIYIQPILHAIILTRDQLDQKLLRLSQLWFFSGLILFGLTPYTQNMVSAILSYSWTLLGIIFISALQLHANNNMNSLFASAVIKADKWVISIGLIVVSFCMIVLSNILGGISNPQISTNFFGFPEQPWSLFYGFIPIAVLLLPDSFKPLASSISLTRLEGQLPLQSKKHINLIPMIIPILFVILLTDRSKGGTGAFLAFSILAFCCLGIPLLFSHRYSQILKYSAYFIVFILSLSAPVLSLVLLYFLYRTINTERNL